MTQGGVGVAAGGNINPDGVSMFEPMGGSAPKYTGKNVISPIASVSALQMMLSFFGEHESAGLVEEAIKKVVSSDMKSMAAGQMGYGTNEVGDLLADYIARS
jgi:3-isopropylmalate dehydrogenase